MSSPQAATVADASPNGAALALDLRNVHTFYGHIHALKGISLTVRQGEIVTLIGANGAGKTTTLRTISGIMHPRQGEVRLNGQRIDRESPHRIVAMGVCQSPEGRRIFPRMTVQENLEMGAFARKDADSARKEDLERVLTLFPRLRERLKQKGGTLSGGEQQMLAVARGLMAAPRLLMLDEPSLGLAPLVVEQLYERFDRLRHDGLTILVVEQYVEVALAFVDRAYVLDKGVVALDGAAKDLAASPQLIEAYLSAAPEEVNA